MSSLRSTKRRIGSFFMAILMSFAIITGFSVSASAEVDTSDWYMILIAYAVDYKEIDTGFLEVDENGEWSMTFQDLFDLFANTEYTDTDSETGEVTVRYGGENLSSVDDLWAILVTPGSIVGYGDVLEYEWSVCDGDTVIYSVSQSYEFDTMTTDADGNDSLDVSGFLEFSNSAVESSIFSYMYEPTIYIDSADYTFNFKVISLNGETVVSEDKVVDTLVDDGTGISAETLSDENLGGLVLDVDVLEEETVDSIAEEISDLEGYSTVICGWNITLTMDGVEVQPDGSVKVTVPINSIVSDYSSLKILRQEEDGTYTDVNAVYDSESGTMSFVTDHFSIYLLVEAEEEDIGSEELEDGNEFDVTEEAAAVCSHGSQYYVANGMYYDYYCSYCGELVGSVLYANDNNWKTNFWALVSQYGTADSNREKSDIEINDIEVD